MAFPEGNVPGSELGLRQFGGLLTREGLFLSSADGRAIPRLVESWQWEQNDRRLRLRLRQNVFFHDGIPLTSQLVVKVLDSAAGNQEQREQYSALADIVGVRPEGDSEVVIDLSRPSGFLLEDLTMPIATGPRIGTGPYRLVDEGPSELVFERFDKYHQGLPEIERIRVKAFDTLRSAWTSLLRDEVDMVTDVPAEAVEFIRTDDVDVITYGRWFQFMVVFNSAREPFRSRAVRQALNVAVNREALIQRALNGYAAPATGPIWPQHWAYDSSVAPYAFDPRLALALLDTAGRRPGAGGPSRTGVPNARLRFTCLVPDNSSLVERIGLELQKQLYDVGVDMRFEMVPLTEYVARLNSGQFQAVLVDMISGPSFARLYNFWRSGRNFKGLNNFGYENPEAERLFQVLRASTSNEAAIRSAAGRLQRVFLEDPPALFLAWNQRTRAVKTAFRVVREEDRDPMPTLWRWTVADAQLAAAR